MTDPKERPRPDRRGLLLLIAIVAAWDICPAPTLVEVPDWLSQLSLWNRYSKPSRLLGKETRHAGFCLRASGRRARALSVQEQYASSYLITLYIRA